MPYKIKADHENEVWRKYTARCLRLITESTAGMVQGKMMTVEYEDIINPKPEEKRSADEIIGNIKDKLNKMK
ncbi:MAG: hypothetical protein IIU66_04160 [Clostridia bacterium]|nr:hypothetical protein [Clostridia bacterium]